MSISRAEAAVMTDTMLFVAIDGRISRLRRDWDEGRPGKLDDIYALAVVRAELEIRELLYSRDQLELPDWQRPTAA